MALQRLGSLYRERCTFNVHGVFCLSLINKRSCCYNSIEKIRVKDKVIYHANPEPKKAANKQCYARNKESICAYKRDKYLLSEPKPVTKEAYMKELQSHLLDNKVMSKLIKAFADCSKESNRQSCVQNSS